MIVVLNDYLVHSCYGLYLGSRFFAHEAFEALMGFLDILLASVLSTQT